MRGIPSRWAECPDVFHRIHIHQWSALGDPKLIGAGLVIPCHPKLFRVCFCCCGISQICKTFRQDITLELLSYKADVECFSHSTSQSGTLWKRIFRWCCSTKSWLAKANSLCSRKENEVVQCWNVCNIYISFWLAVLHFPFPTKR